MNQINIYDDWELTSLLNSFNTLVLFGKTGNGKSATGNSILGTKAFVSKPSFYGVTSTCELKSTTMKDGRIVNVIDTPGLFDRSDNSEDTVKEIVKCVNLAKDGIHAILMVFSVRSRFSPDEESAIETLKTLFGEKIVDYMIAVFTGGDELEDGQTLKDFFGHEEHHSLQKFLHSCKNRIVLFDNKTKDENKRARQVQELLHLVDLVVESNGRRPFSDKLFDELKEGATWLQRKEKDFESMKGQSEEQIAKLKAELYESYEKQLGKITEMVEQKLKEVIERLEKQLAQEQDARQGAERKSEEEIRKLTESLEAAKREAEEFRKRSEGGIKCAIL